MLRDRKVAIAQSTFSRHKGTVHRLLTNPKNRVAPSTSIPSTSYGLCLHAEQVVPHEVMGMSNFNKNLFVGLGGKEAIDHSHFIGACYGMERMMGKADNPLRRILNRAAEDFLRKLPLVSGRNPSLGRANASNYPPPPSPGCLPL